LSILGAISKTEFFGHLLTSDEFGCIDEWVCLVNQVQEESDKVASEFQELYGKLFKVKFVPKERPKSMSPAPAARVNQERRDSIPIRERQDSDRTSDRTRKDSDRERKNSDRERRDSLRERSNSSSLSDKNGIAKIGHDSDSNSRISTPEPTKVQANGKNQINSEQLVSTANFLESEFKTSDGASVYNSLSTPVVTETKSEKRNSVVSIEENVSFINSADNASLTIFYFITNSNWIWLCPPTQSS